MVVRVVMVRLGHRLAFCTGLRRELVSCRVGAIVIRLIKSAVPVLLVLSSIAFADGVLPPASPAPAPQQEAAPRLEYKVLKYHVGFNSPEADLTKIANDLAADGWTLVSSSATGDEIFVFFSRPRK